MFGKTDPVGTTPAIYIVQLASPALASHQGGTPGLAATNPQVRSAVSLDMASVASAPC